MLRNFARIISCFIIVSSLFLLSGCGSTSGGSGSATGNSSISGVILSSTGSPLQGATVIVDGQTTTTQSDGSYQISGIDQGSKIVTVTKGGYISNYKTVSVSGSTTAPKINLTVANSKKVVISTSTGGQAYCSTDNSEKGIVLNISSIQTIGTSSLASNAIEMSITYVDTADLPFQFTGANIPVWIAYVQPVNILFNGDIEFINKPGISIDELYYLDLNTFTWSKVDSAVNTSNAGISCFSLTTAKGGFYAAVKVAEEEELMESLSGNIVDQNGTPLSGVMVLTDKGAVSITDESGSYTVNDILIGDLELNAFYYTDDNVAMETVIQNISASTNTLTTITLNIVETYEISGSIPNGNGGTVYVEGSQEYQRYYIEIIGNSYSISKIPSGDYRLIATVPGYHPITTTISVTDDTICDFTLDAITNYGSLADSYVDNFEGAGNSISDINGGWKTTGMWHRQANPENVLVSPTLNNEVSIYPDLIWETTYDYVTINQAVSIYSPNEGFIETITLNFRDSVIDHLPPAYSGDYAYWFGEESNGTFIGSPNVEGQDDNSGGDSFSTDQYTGTLTSPTLNTSAFGYGVKVSFKSWWEIEAVDPAEFDMLWIRFSYDGGQNWIQTRLNPNYDPQIQEENMALSSGADTNEPGVWESQTLELDARFITDQFVMQFYFSTEDEAYNAFRGWLIDDIAIEPGSGVLSAEFENGDEFEEYGDMSSKSISIKSIKKTRRPRK